MAIGDAVSLTGARAAGSMTPNATWKKAGQCRDCSTMPTAGWWTAAGVGSTRLTIGHAARSGCLVGGSTNESNH